MATNEEGEFELVLGNRQLLSGFFIIVVLFGVFFTMGYMVGRHSFPAPSTTATAANQDGIPPQPVTPGPPPGQAEVLTAEAQKPAPATSENSEPETGTRPATAPAEVPRPAERKRAESSPAGASASQPAPGIYLQVAAPKRTAAEGVIESLKNKGIAAVLAPGPNEDTVRVLVGPLESANIGKMKMDLESAGFKPFAKKY